MKDVQETIDFLKNISLSNVDVMKLVNGKAKVLLYSELKNYKTLDEALGEYGAMFLLIETRPDYGHWTCVFKQTKDLIECFDSYGDFIDTQLEYIPSNFREISGQEYPMLTYLLYHSPYDISYNQHKFQKLGDGIATCGRWSSLRILLRDLPLKKFYDLFHGKKADDVVSILTSLV